MIEKSFLPVWFFNPQRQESLANHRSQCLNPFSQCYAFGRQRHKDMRVVGHENVATNRDRVLLCMKAEGAKCFMDFRTCEQRQPFIGVERYKIQLAHV